MFALTTSARMLRAIILALVLLPMPTRGQDIQQALSSVVLVVARECASAQGAKAGSGFVWRDQTTVVTAFHVVTNCQSLSVRTSAGSVPAQLDRVLVDADLAMLRLASPLPAAPLNAAPSSPSAGDEVVVLGFPLNVPTPDSRFLRIVHATPNARRLRSLLPADAAGEIERAGIPSLDIEILRIDGNILPGHSGGPIVNRVGQVVGIGSGGLQSGAVGVGWAVSSRYLNGLPSGLAGRDAPAIAATSFGFRAPAPDQRFPQVTCGDLSVYRSHTATLAQLVASNDDPAGLNYLAQFAGYAPDELQQLRFTVYVEPGSGLSLVVPENTILFPDPQGCSASFVPNGGIFLRVMVGRAPNNQTAYQRFSPGFQPRHLQWVPYVPFSYTAPRTRPDGTEVYRHAGVSAPMGLGESFRTVIHRRETFGAIEVNNYALNPTLEFQCRNLGPAMMQVPNCTSYFQFKRFWAAMVLGAHLTTMPPI
ncbi:S1C family serine protease [Phreatobacter oligotrophus]|uniref:Trypsin-like peptidase n=1 Tax=Phreatobacter oligotrophus TaxID=1122261 RepID=A0A2T4ZIH1_9HYPH|nr:serine protease [Phreatobacter oligotrophus]PTM61764.1 trypsin-like peptidase [Phreatobacter oligotrophus]